MAGTFRNTVSFKELINQKLNNIKVCAQRFMKFVSDRIYQQGLSHTQLPYYSAKLGRFNYFTEGIIAFLSTILTPPTSQVSFSPIFISCRCTITAPHCVKLCEFDLTIM